MHMLMEHVSTALLLTWQKLSMILVLLTSCSGESSFYVTPTPNTPCPGEPCHTLSEYVAIEYFDNLTVNTTMEFLPGNHTLGQTITMTILQKLTLQGDPSSLPEVSSRIVCTWPAGFVFTKIGELHISAMAFISCGHPYSAAIHMRSVQQCEISDCTFQSCISDYNIVLQVGAPYIEDSTLTPNTFYNYSPPEKFSGGALDVAYSTLTVTGCTFYNNSAITGGALCVEGGTLNLTGNTFQNNSVRIDGGALLAIIDMLILLENTFQNNSAGATGGALRVEYGTHNLSENTFKYNSAGIRGGALSASHAMLNLTGSTFQYNTADVDGGALSVSEGNVNLTRNTFLNNTAYDSAGAVYVFYGILHSIGNHFQNNHAAFGGTLHMDGSHVTFADDHFPDNYAQFQGGAVLATGISRVEMHNISIDNNRAKYGGGMAAVDSQLKVFEITFQNNGAIYGGGLYLHNTEFNGTAIISKNSASEGGGGIYASMSTIFFVDNTTIITKNSAMNGGGLLLSGNSKLYQQSGSAVHFTSNSAMSTGGAIKVEESDPLTYCIPLTTSFYVSNSECFFQIIESSTSL